MEEAEFEMIYPTFQVIEDRGIIPRVYLPRDYLSRIPLFYEQKRETNVEQYVNELERSLAQGTITKTYPEIRLYWDEKSGLINISIGVQGGFDLVGEVCPHFQEHNLSTGNGFAAACVATKYVSELLKS